MLAFFGLGPLGGPVGALASVLDTAIEALTPLTTLLHAFSNRWIRFPALISVFREDIPTRVKSVTLQVAC